MPRSVSHGKFLADKVAVSTLRYTVPLPMKYLSGLERFVVNQFKLRWQKAFGSWVLKPAFMLLKI